jgi:CRP-like cAMP-binding protein
VKPVAKVLLAHGDTHQLELAVQTLAAEGYEVVATPDGGDAFARFFEEDPDVVVASVVLPVLDGCSFAAMIRSQTPDVPVVLLTAELPAEPAEGILYLEEPLDVEMLRALVPALQPRPRAGGEVLLEVSEASREVYDTLVSFQRQGNILSLLDPAGLERLAGIATIGDHEAGELVIHEGDPCNGFYLVVLGAVRVTLAERGDEEVARLGPGEFFGEMALLSEQPRSASVWTCDPSKLLFFERDAVLELLRDYPPLRELLGGVALQRAEENLWQALAADDDVQRNLSDLLAGLDADAGARSAQIREEPPAFEPPPPGESPAAVLESQTGGQGPPLAAPSTPAPPLAAPPEPTPQSQPGGLLQAMRLYWTRHQFGMGMTLGALVGIVAMAAVATVFLDQDKEPAPPEVPSRIPAMVASDVEAIAADSGAETGEGVADTGEEADREVVVGEEAEAGGEPEEDLPVGAGLDELAKRPLRNRLLSSYNAGDFEDALASGLELERRFHLDWEAEFVTAQAARQAGFDDRALALYGSFCEKYPDNVYADDARFWSAKVLAGRGDLARAREFFEAVAADPRSNLRRRAAKRAAELQ